MNDEEYKELCRKCIAAGDKVEDKIRKLAIKYNYPIEKVSELVIVELLPLAEEHLKLLNARLNAKEERNRQ